MKNLLILTVLAAFFACTPTTSKPTINVMTYNIRYNNPNDSLNSWPYRKDVAASLINFYDVDVLGTQEVLNDQIEDLVQRLPTYAYVGVGRQDGVKKGEYSAIFYKKDRFELLTSGNFWLSEDPSAVGVIGWDGACERIATWAQLQDKASKEIVFVFNTHFDHIGVQARKNSSKLILDKVNEIAGTAPCIITGDFNSEPTSEVYADLTKADNPLKLTDSKQLAKIKHGVQSSFHNFGRIPLAERNVIDYIFVKNKVNVLRYGIIEAQIDGIYLSDHNPILVSVQL